MKNIPQESIRREMYRDIIPSFEEQDSLLQFVDELFGRDPAYDKAVRDLYPNDFEPIGSPYRYSDDDDDDEI
jgi:hypothetical protein